MINIPAIKKTILGKNVKIGSFSTIFSSSIKDYSYVGSFCSVVSTDIGKYCSIADFCLIGGASHPTTWVSTSPVFHTGKNIFNKNFTKNFYNPYEKKTTIGNDVWLGHNCIVKSGVTISDGCIIGAGSILTKNTGPYEIWAGNPAKLIRKRFEESIIIELINIKWWEWPNSKIRSKAIYFNNPAKLLENLL
jgi:acetyltransferase-like isoleucine patch superfamily enzyme